MGRLLPSAARAIAAMLAAAAVLGTAGAAPPIYKCVADGKVTFQSDPCVSGPPAVRPTVEQLNRERLRKQRDGANAAATPPAGATAGPAALPPPAGPATAAIPVVPAAAARFRCDGRQYCSQMTSCAEAKYFLAHCPAVRMDGNGDGIPCERQWCN